jgi:hypothetical protein
MSEVFDSRLLTQLLTSSVKEQKDFDVKKRSQRIEIQRKKKG